MAERTDSGRVTPGIDDRKLVRMVPVVDQTTMLGGRSKSVGFVPERPSRGESSSEVRCCAKAGLRPLLPRWEVSGGGELGLGFEVGDTLAEGGEGALESLRSEGPCEAERASGRRWR